MPRSIPEPAPPSSVRERARPRRCSRRADTGGAYPATATFCDCGSTSSAGTLQGERDQQTRHLAGPWCSRTRVAGGPRGGPRPVCATFRHAGNDVKARVAGPAAAVCSASASNGAPRSTRKSAGPSFRGAPPAPADVRDVAARSLSSCSRSARSFVRRSGNAANECRPSRRTSSAMQQLAA